MRNGRYKKNYLTVDQCHAFAEEFGPPVRSLFQEFQSGRIAAPEFVAGYVFMGLQILKPKSWKGSRIGPAVGTALKEPIFPKWLSIFEQFSLRGLPIAVNHSLLRWYSNEYSLQLFFEIPSTETVLKMQSQGIRCVTCLLETQDLQKYVLDERDPLSFTVHDLIHADHFLGDIVQRQVQVGFSRWLLEIWQHPELQAKMSTDIKFHSNFEYACADMNSHGAHLLKYLKAIFCQTQQENLFLSLSRVSTFSSAFTDSLRNLNTSRETPADLSYLQNALFQKGQPAASEPIGTPYPSQIGYGVPIGCF
jgi:hypothetical protein